MEFRRDLQSVRSRSQPNALYSVGRLTGPLDCGDDQNWDDQDWAIRRALSVGFNESASLLRAPQPLIHLSRDSFGGASIGACVPFCGIPRPERHGCAVPRLLSYPQLSPAQNIMHESSGNPDQAENRLVGDRFRIRDVVASKLIANYLPYGHVKVGDNTQPQVLRSQGLRGETSITKKGLTISPIS
jgi:hypothetical protein